MMEIAAKLSWSDKSEARIGELIESARRKFIKIYPNQNFDAYIWSVHHLCSRPTADSIRHLRFTKLGSKLWHDTSDSDPVDALPEYFADVVKSWLIHDSLVTTGSYVSRLGAARHFWRFLSTKQPERAAAFRWNSLTENDLLAFELHLKSCQSGRGETLSPDTIIGIIQQLQQLVDFLTSRGICRRISYAVRTRSRRQASALLLDEKQRAAESKLPAPGVLEALGDIYHRLTTAPAGQVSDWILLLISAIGVLMLTGIRLGELVTLPFDCEVEEKLPGKRPGDPERYIYGLRYRPEKTRAKSLIVKWISPTAEPIVRAAISRIKTLTADARQRAKLLEADPTRVPLPSEYMSRSTLRTSEVYSILGLKGNVLPKKLRRADKHRIGWWDVKDIEVYLVEKQLPNLYTVKEGDCILQSLSESLFIAFEGQSRYLTGIACSLLVRPITAPTIANFMSLPRDGRRTSVFAQFGTTEEQKALSTNSHSFRHWLNHIAYKGKMPVHLITRYFARENARDTRDYLHFTPEETGSYIQDEIRAARVFGPVAKTYWSLPPELREDYLIGQVSVGHFTPWGLCTRNFALEPCEKHVNCLNDCGSFCSVKGNKGEIAALLDLQAKTKALLKAAESAKAAGMPWADSWVAYHSKTLAKTHEVLLKHLDETIEDGTIVQPFDGQPSRHSAAFQ
jgi:hypothetical protein